MVQKNNKKAAVQFFRDNPNPSDKQVHAFAEELGMDEHRFEELVYSILSALLAKNGNKKAGKHTDVPDEDFDPEELKMGIEIEKEHTDNPELAKNIAKDHLTELPDYYTRLKKMEKEGEERPQIKEEAEEFPEAISMRSFPDQMIEQLGAQLDATDLVEDINYDEIRLGLIRELDNMEVYTMRNLTHERMMKAASKVFETLYQNPSFYSDPPPGQEEEGNPLINQQGQLGPDVYKRNPLTTRNEHIERLVEQVMLEEGLLDLLKRAKTATSAAWGKTKAALQKASQGAVGAINTKVTKARELKGALEGFKNMVAEAEKEAGEKLPISNDMKIAMKLPSLAKQAAAEINAEKQAVAKAIPAQQQQQPQKQEAYARHVTNILNEIRTTKKQQSINEAAITMTSILGLVMAVMGGVPMILKGLYKLAEKLGLKKTSAAIHHAWHVVHKLEEKVVDYIIPDKLSYILYNKAWKKGFKTSKVHLEFEQYRADQGGARKKVENLVYKIILVYFLFAGFEVILEAGASMIGVAKSAANTIKAIEIAGGVIEAGEIIAPVVLAGRVATV